MKKKILIVVIVIIALLLLVVPKVNYLRDGGSVEYKAILYTVTKYHKIKEASVGEYSTGTRIEILGKEVYNTIETIANNQTDNEKNTNDNNKLESETQEEVVICAYDKNFEETDETTSFYAKVISSNLNSIIVEPVEGSDELKSSDKISIGLGENNDALYEVGKIVKITYNGIILETYPAQIKPIKIEVKSADNFELIFNERKDLEVKTIVSKDETDKYSYGIYSRGGDVKIKIDNTQYDLRDALLNDKITMEEIIAKANQDLENKMLQANDGGSIEYPYDTYTIIKLHRINGNRDVYIGNTEMHIDDVTDY